MPQGYINKSLQENLNYKTRRLQGGRTDSPQTSQSQSLKAERGEN